MQLSGLRVRQVYMTDGYIITATAIFHHVKVLKPGGKAGWRFFAEAPETADFNAALSLITEEYRCEGSICVHFVTTFETAPLQSTSLGKQPVISILRSIPSAYMSVLSSDWLKPNCSGAAYSAVPIRYVS